MSSIGIDFGGTTIKSGLVVGGEIIHRAEPINTETLGSPEHIVDALVALVRQYGEHRTAPVAVGIGLPGLINHTTGIVHELTNVPGWDEVPLRQILRERTGLSVTIENDAKAMTYGEWKYGAARNARNVVCITLGTGVGGALILDGRLYLGSNFAAGEIGHMSIDYRGIPGPYGNFGGFEEYVGNAQIAARALKLYAQAGVGKTIEECTPLALDRAARAGDAIAKSLWQTLGIEIGAALASVVWILNPDTIVIGGGVANAGDLLFDPIRREIAARTIKIFNGHLRILPATLGNEAGMIGNAALALDACGSA